MHIAKGLTIGGDMVQPVSSRRHELSPLHAGNVKHITHVAHLYGPQSLERSRVYRYSAVAALVELAVDEAETIRVARHIDRVLRPPSLGAHKCQ